MTGIITLIGLLLFAAFVVLGALIAAWVDSLDDGGDR